MRMPIQIKPDAMACAVGEMHARRWQEAIALAQGERAKALGRRLEEGRLDRIRYRNWLAMELEACRIGVLSLQAVAAWHGPQPALQMAALAWTDRVREDAHAAAHDLHTLDAAPPPPVLLLQQWRTFAGAAGSSQRAGEVLGAALLHDGLFDGPMHAVATAISALPFAVDGRYLSRRLRSASGTAAEQTALLGAYAATALAVGAQRAAGWCREALAHALR